jgi:putative membrane protein
MALKPRLSYDLCKVCGLSIEIENPFGYDPNDLPLDQICRTMQINIEDLISLEPCTQHWQENEDSKHSNV